MLIVVLPVIIPFSFEGETNFGDNVQATCHVSKGDSPLQLTWSFQGLNSNSSALEKSVKTLKVSERTNLLEIPEAFSAHSGHYTCAARNKAGSVAYTATLMVNGNYLEETRKKTHTKNTAAKQISNQPQLRSSLVLDRLLSHRMTIRLIFNQFHYLAHSFVLFLSQFFVRLTLYFVFSRLSFKNLLV